MIYPAEKVLNEYQKVLDGYTGLLTCRLLNLCVKSHPIALIPVIVELWGEDKTIEEVADVGIPDEDHITVFPKNPEFMFAIGKGVLEVHPEFQMEEKNMEINGNDVHYLSFKMPEVDKNRRDVLNSGVDAFYEEAKGQFETTRVKYSDMLMDKLTDDKTGKDSDDYKNRFDDYFKNNSNVAEQTVNDKKKEIEEAYQRYLQKKDAATQAVQEQQAAEGEDVKSQFKMPTE